MCAVKINRQKVEKHTTVSIIGQQIVENRRNVCYNKCIRTTHCLEITEINMKQLFNVIPSGFFNCLASGSNNEIYAECLRVIYEKYDREISYRIPKVDVRDAVAEYLLYNDVNNIDDEYAKDVKDANELANAIIRKFCSEDIGWLEEDEDDITYEKYIIMTEPAILLAEFLQQLREPQRDEYAGYICNIYNVLRSKEQWEQEPYVACLKNINRNAKMLSKSLKRLSTFMRDIIERMVHEGTLESLTENIIEYCDGDFVREYARLAKQQNIYIYRGYIRNELDKMEDDHSLYELLVAGCAAEEKLDVARAADTVQDMIARTKTFLFDDYNRIMQEIKHKINVYLQIAVGRARFLRNRGTDAKSSVEQTIKYIVEEMNTLDRDEELPDMMNDMFLLDKHEFIDKESVRFPRKAQTIRKKTNAILEEITQEDMRAARLAYEREVWNPYSKEKMTAYLKLLMGEKESINSEELPMESKQELLSVLSAVAYAKEIGYEVRVREGYTEKNNMILRNFDIIKGETL